MRPIENLEIKQKRVKRKQLAMGIVLISLMVLSSVGFAFSNNSNDSTLIDKKKFNGFTFNLKGDRWYSIIEGQEFITKFNPDDTKEISIENNNSINDYTGKPLYFAGDRGDHFSEIELNLGNRIVQRIQLACIDEEKCEGDLPIKDCKKDNIIIYTESNNGTEKIYQKNQCVYIISSFQNQALYADAFLFDILGVTQ